MYSRRMNLAEDRMNSLGREETGGIRDSAAREKGSNWIKQWDRDARG